MALKYEIKAKQGTYTNQNGEEKANWVKIGAVFETQKGLSIKLEAIPIGWDGWASLYLPDRKSTRLNSSH